MARCPLPILVAVAVIALLLAPCVFGDIFSYEADSFPTEAGWEVGQNYCDPEEWVEGGRFWQHVDICEGQPPPGGQQSSYQRSLVEYVGAERFFVEWKMETDGDSSQMIYGAPATFTVWSMGPVNYGFTIARDRVKLNRDNTLPLVLVDIEPGVPHTYRLELEGDAWYGWYIDNVIVDEGVPEGQYPSYTPTITFRARYYFSASTAQWDYMRWGDTPIPASGDFDSNGQVSPPDLYFFQDYFSGPDVDAGPGARWADFDLDTDVDCDDWEAFQLAWTGPPDPPPLAPCDLNPIPAVSDWGVVLMTLLLLTAGTILFRRVPPLST
jgi:hypothetical protein